MINKPLPFKGPSYKAPSIILTQGRGIINQGSTLGLLLGLSFEPAFETVQSQPDELGPLASNQSLITLTTHDMQTLNPEPFFLGLFHG